MANKIREEFEKFASDHCMLSERSFECDQYDPDEYLDTDCQLAWEAYAASLTNMVIELPHRLDMKPYACYENGWSDMYDEAKYAIEQCGIEVE